jgi:hypothetical protein
VPKIVWPSRVVQPARPPVLVYLDLNHYIYLARTAAGLTAPDGYDGLLRAATAARQQDRAVFPLSGTHYMEMSAILDPAQRTAVAQVMESLSGLRVPLGRVTLAELEIDAMIDAFLSSGSAADRIDLLGPTCGVRCRRRPQTRMGAFPACARTTLETDAARTETGIDLG